MLGATGLPGIAPARRARGATGVSRRGWHMTRLPDGGVVLARAAPRFDVWAETRLPAASPPRIAHQVRQDVWRALRRLRGFAPVVSVTPSPEGLLVRAGGAVAGAVPPGTAGEIAVVLEDGANRARWLVHAARGRG